MKLLFAYYVPSGGMETLNRERCHALMRHGVECRLLYLRSGTGLQNIHRIPTYVTDDDYGIAEHLRREKFDAVIVSSWYPLLYRVRQLGYYGPAIFEAQGLGSYEKAVATLMEAVPFVNDQAAALLGPNTSHLMKLFREIYPRHRRYFFDNCLDTASFSYRANNAPPAPVIGWVGRIEANKNWRLWLDIARRFLAHVPNLTLWLFEDDTLSGEKIAFNARVAELGLENRLVRRSNIPHAQMADYYSMIGDSGGLLLSTSVLEGFGYAVLEAMACRCPVVATDSDGVRTFIVHNETGKMFAQGDAAGAEREAYDIVFNRARRARIRDAAERRVRERFSPDLFVRRFLAMLRELGVRA